MSPAFDSGTKTYTASTDASSETVTATATDNDDIVSITVDGDALENGGTAEWAEGENTVVVKVTDHNSPDVSSTYTVTVTYTP